MEKWGIKTANYSLIITFFLWLCQNLCFCLFCGCMVFKKVSEFCPGKERWQTRRWHSAHNNAIILEPICWDGQIAKKKPKKQLKLRKNEWDYLTLKGVYYLLLPWEKVMWQSVFVCQQSNSKSYKRMLMKIDNGQDD